MKKAELESPYKVGDLVKFVKKGKIGWESYEWHKKDGLVKGCAYKISCVMGDGGLHLEGMGYFHHPDHFEKFEGVL